MSLLRLATRLKGWRVGGAGGGGAQGEGPSEAGPRVSFNIRKDVTRLRLRENHTNHNHPLFGFDVEKIIPSLPFERDLKPETQ